MDVSELTPCHKMHFATIKQTVSDSKQIFDKQPNGSEIPFLTTGLTGATGIAKTPQLKMVKIAFICRKRIA